MSRDELIAMAKQSAAAHDLPPEIVCAICERESAWDPWAIRYEPTFFSHYVAGQYTNGKIDATEAYARAFSWGLGQLMGQVARELGYAERLAKLCDPQTGLEWLCRELAHKMATNEGNLAVALEAYNGGNNRQYAAEVIAKADAYRQA